MKTLKLSKATMEKRVSKFAELEPLPIQIDKTVPQAGKDIVYARELLSVIGLDPSEGTTPINSGAPIIGAGGITMTLAKCPPGQGPGLHNHLATFETFTVLEGKFLIKWNDDGSEELILKLEELELLSIKISDNISNGNYDKIVQLDLKRQDIIKSINPNHAISFRNEISNLLKTNDFQVREVERNISKFQENSKYSLECFAAYKKK